MRQTKWMVLAGVMLFLMAAGCTAPAHTVWVNKNVSLETAEGVLRECGRAEAFLVEKDYDGRWHVMSSAASYKSSGFESCMRARGFRAFRMKAQ